MPDIFHINSYQLHDEQKAQILKLKRTAQVLMSDMKLPVKTVDTIKQSAAERCINIAYSKLEEAVMWATKGISTL